MHILNFSSINNNFNQIRVNIIFIIIIFTIIIYNNISYIF